MTDNPYNPPKNTSELSQSENSSKFNKIAKLQWILNFIVFGYMILVFLFISLPKENEIFEMLLSGITIVFIIYSLITVIRIAKEMNGIVSVIFHSVVLLIPLVGFISLLSLNSQATQILKHAGYKIGLFGAKLKQ